MEEHILQNGHKVRTLHRLVEYTTAVAWAATGMIVRWGLCRSFGGELPTYITFYPVVILCALTMGMRAGISTTLLCALAATYWVIEPMYSFNVMRSIDAVGLVFFVGTGVMLSWVASGFERIKQRNRTFETQLLEQEAVTRMREERALELLTMNEKKDEYMATLAHELRNPLSAILSGIEVVKICCKGTCGQDVVQVRDIIHQQTVQMSRLIDDLLDVCRIARGKVQLRLCRLDLVRAVRESCDSHVHLFKGRGLQFNVNLPDKPMWCEADPVRITQIISNLVHNSLKFTETGSISISMSRSGQIGELTVKDTGIGIDKDFLPNIFDPFIQADHHIARTKGGLGLGLALVHGLVKLHHGNISVNSQLGQGTAFTITLPLCNDDTSPCLPVSTSILTKSLRVLAIDDRRDGLFVLRTLLKQLGQSIDTAADGLSGIEKAIDIMPDAILCDIGLPDIDGYEVARRLRKDPRFDKTLLVAVTGYSREEDVRLAMQAGFDYHVAKPVSIRQVEQILATV